MDNELMYKKAAKCFEQSLLLGNGRLGAAVFGNMKNERIALNEDTLWSGYPKELNNKKAHESLEKLRNAIFSNDFETAKNISNTDFHGNWVESYLPFGDLIINFKGHISKKHYKRTLDISKGIASVSCDGIKETVFVSNPANLIVINLSSDKPFSCSISFQSKLKNKVFTNEDSLVIEGEAPGVCFPPYYHVANPVIYDGKGMHFTGIAKVFGNAFFAGDYIGVFSQNDITLVLSLATSFIDFESMPTGDSFQKAESYLKNIKGYKALLNEHIKYFNEVFSRVSFTLESSKDNMPTDKRLKEFKKHDKDNALIALLFQYGRYLMISSSAPGSEAANLQGIWNEHLRAPWSSNYTMNINTEMNYWGSDICNLSEFFTPLFDLAKKLAQNGKKTAESYYSCRGWCAHHNSDIWGNTNPAGHPNGDGDDSAYSIWCSSGPWILNMLWDHYEYIKDERYKKELIPLFEGCLQFYKDFLIEKDGEFVTCPSLSPENEFIVSGKGYSTTYMPSMDREILHDFFINCKKLGLDAPEIENVKVASDGRIPEWIEEYEEKWPEHRHLSHLYCIYPSSYECSDEIKRAAEKSLEARGFGGTGWSLGWKICLWARLKNGVNAAKLIKNQLYPVNSKINTGHGGTYPNMLDAHPPFQIDGNFAASAGIAEMIKNDAMPKDWNGEIKGLKLKNGVLNAKIKNGKLTEKIIITEEGNK